MRRRRSHHDGFPRLPFFFALSLLSPPSVSVSAQTYQVAWTTDRNYLDYNGQYGPDGPWQAIAVAVGNTSRSSTDLGGAYAPMWPSGGSVSTVLTTKVPGGNYTPSESTTAIEMGTVVGNGDSWMSYSAQREESWGRFVYDVVTLTDKTHVLQGDASGRQFLQINATLAAYDEAVFYHPYDDASSKARQIKLTPSVGILGLGVGEWSLFANGAKPVGILKLLKQEGVIGYEGFGLHMGSARHKQSGSLVLGGYEKNRALGEVGTFKFVAEELPYMFLVDVLLGTQLEAGASPFKGGRENEGSIWQNPNVSPAFEGSVDPATYLRESLGGKNGSAVVIPNPAVPYIYLPRGICEAVAKRLPLAYNETLGLHTWKVDDLAYRKVMRSSAYMAFVFSDTSAKNVTVKVPFQLLNLTLEDPLVDRPTPYFPCQTLDPPQYGLWTLGRAFLQAAFLGVDFERNVTYLAQAPGPVMEQRVVKDFDSVGEAMKTSDISGFEESWASLWEVVQDDGAGLSTGVIAGIVVGVVAGVCLLFFAVVLWWKKKSRKSPDQSERIAEKMDDRQGGSPAGKVELDTERDVAELGVPTAYEMGCPSSDIKKEHAGVETPVVLHEKEVPENTQEVPAPKIEWVELPADIPISFLNKGRKGGESDEKIIYK